MKRLQAAFGGGAASRSILTLRVCASECLFINTSALAGALREHNADEEGIE